MASVAPTNTQVFRLMHVAIHIAVDVAEDIAENHVATDLAVLVHGVPNCSFAAWV